MTDKTIECFELDENEANVEASRNVTKNGQKITINKCNQCKYTSSHAGNLRTHLKRHSGEKSNKCKQAGNLRRHLKMHSGEK